MQVPHHTHKGIKLIIGSVLLVAFLLFSFGILVKAFNFSSTYQSNIDNFNLSTKVVNSPTQDLNYGTTVPSNSNTKIILTINDTTPPSTSSGGGSGGSSCGYSPLGAEPCDTGPTPTCFTGNTSILLANGSSIPIQNIKPGDEVLSFPQDSPLSGTRPSVVTALIVHPNNPGGYNHVVLSNGVQLNVTNPHPMLTSLGLNGRPAVYTLMKNLNVGDTLYWYNSTQKTFNPVKITEKMEINSTQAVYTLTVNNTHTFFANDIAVHNKILVTPTG